MIDSQDAAIVEVSIVIPCLNAAATIGLQLEALQHQETKTAFEIIVVDNGSTDGTAEIARSFPGVRVLTETVRGANRARNSGISEASGELVLLTDADDLVSSTWVDSLVQGLRGADLVGGPIELFRLNDVSCRALWGIRQPIRSLDSRGPYPAAIGTNCGFHKDVWRVIGPFDETLGVANDEYEFFWRAGANGYSYKNCEESLVHYRLRCGRSAILRHLFRAGRADVRTYRVARSLGYRPDGLLFVAKTYGRVAGEVVAGVGNRDRRWLGLRVGARRLGRLVESLKSRTYFL